MSRFGTQGRFYWDSGDVLSSSNPILLEIEDMFQFPFETSSISDAISYRSKSGRRFEYKNWSKDTHTFTWVGLQESKKDELFEMVHSLPIVSFSSPLSTDWGTFRVTPDSWSDSETSHERYDVSFTIEGI